MTTGITSIFNPERMSSLGGCSKRKTTISQFSCYHSFNESPWHNYREFEQSVQDCCGQPGENYQFHLENPEERWQNTRKSG